MKNKQKHGFNNFFIYLLIIFGFFTPIKVLANPISLQRLKLFPEEYTKNDFYTVAWYIRINKHEGKYIMAIESLDNGTYLSPQFFCQEGIVAFVLSKDLANKLINLNLSDNQDYLVKIYATKLQRINRVKPSCRPDDEGYFTNVQKIHFLNRQGKVLAEIK